MANRELGTETSTCPTCGAELATTTNPDGSTSPVRCDNCYPVDLVEEASTADATQASKPVEREHGTQTDERNADDE